MIWYVTVVVGTLMSLRAGILYLRANHPPKEILVHLGHIGWPDRVVDWRHSLYPEGMTQLRLRAKGWELGAAVVYIAGMFIDLLSQDFILNGAHLALLVLGGICVIRILVEESGQKARSTSAPEAR